jgi:L-ascorbate metabolism protein UlaG (beta-lactamase superfamily)
MVNPQTLEDPTRAFLAKDVKVEPLVDRWHAWPQLLSPAVHALNLKFRYLPLLHSFLNAPQVHVAANNNPAMYGGPFLALPMEAVGEVRDYVTRVEAERGSALRFAEAFRGFDLGLQVADGYCLNEFREKLPEYLHGQVELAYDLNHHPRMRLYEEMFSHDSLGHGAAQELLLHRQRDEDRPFFLSTPRISEGLGTFIRTPIGSDLSRMLGAARYEALDLRDLSKATNVALDHLAPYFSSEPSRTASPYKGDGVRVRYFGHASLLIEAGGLSILVDPTFASMASEAEDHLTYDDLPDKIDVVFISHGHHDHFNTETLMRLRGRVGTVLIPPSNRGEPADPSLKRILRTLGYDSVVVMEQLEPYPIPNGAITALPFSGEHCDLDVHSKHCALIEIKGRRICALIDSDAIDIHVYSRLIERLAKPDLMFIGMECSGAPLTWLYGPLLSSAVSRRNDNSRRLSGANAANARRLTEALMPKQVFVYAMGQEPWMRYLMGLQYADDSIQLSEAAEFISFCRSIGIPADRLYLRMECEI